MKIKNKEEYKYIIFLSLIILGISLVVFRQYIFGEFFLFNKSLLSDIIRANVPTYYHIYDAIAEGGAFWSWQMGAGTSMFSHADTFFDPFMYITFLFGKTHILDMLVWMYIAKIVCEGIAFYLYIRYFRVNSTAAMFGGILYAFSGYSMIMGSNFALGTILVYLPLILLGAEKYINEHKKVLLFVMLFLTCIMSYYFFYITAIGLAIYVLYRMIYKRSFSLKKLIGFLILGILAMGSGMLVLLPQIELLLQSSRITGKTDALKGIDLFIPSVKTFFTALIRSVSNDALGNVYTTEYLGETYSIKDYFGEVTFSGTLFFYFVSVLFYNEKKDTKKKYTGLLILVFAFILLPFISFAANAFSTLNARWMYWITLLQCVVVVLAINKTLKNHKVIYRNLYITSFVFLLIVILGGSIILSAGMGYAYTLSSLTNSIVPALMVIISIYILFPLISFGIRIIYKFFNKKKGRKFFENKTVLMCSLIIVFGIDVITNYYWWYGSEYSVSEYSEENQLDYEDESSIIVKNLLPTKDEFYRINKSFDSVITDGEIPSLNDAMIQGYYGLKNYNSLGNAPYTEFLQRSGCYCTVPSMIPIYQESGVQPLEIKGQEINYINGVENRYNLMSYLGVKYYISKNDEEIVPEYFNFLFKRNGFSVYKNPYNMPLVFCNPETMSEDKYDSLSDNEKEIALLLYTIVENSEREVDQISNLDSALKNIQKNQSRFSISSFSNDNIFCEINVPPNNKYVSTTIPYDSNWEVYVDGEKVDTQKVNIGFVGFKATEGHHTVQLRYHLKSFYFGCLISAISILISILILVATRIKADIKKS